MDQNFAAKSHSRTSVEACTESTVPTEEKKRDWHCNVIHSFDESEIKCPVRQEVLPKLAPKIA